MRVGDVVFANDDFGVDAGRVNLPQHVRDAPYRAASRRGPTRNLHRHHLAGRRAAFVSRRNENIHEHAPVEWHDVAHARVVSVVAADDPCAAALENADHAAFDAPTLFDSLDTHDDAIAVHGFVQELWRNIDVAARFEWTLGCDEPVPGRVRLQPSDVEVHLLGQAEAMAADLNELAGCDERFDVSLERRALVARDLQ